MEKLTYIQSELFSLQDKSYRDFHSALMPNINKKLVIGVRTPVLRKLAKRLWKEDKDTCRAFMKKLPHKYYEENNLHAVFIQNIDCFEDCLSELENFLPYIDNWATCDMLNPAVLGKYKEDLLLYEKKWLSVNEEYTVRYAIGILMRYFLNEDFKAEYLSLVANIKRDEYYIKMMIAWYFATALAKQYDSAISYIEEGKLDKWVHNKAIQKAIESNRIGKDTKDYLRKLKQK